MTVAFLPWSARWWHLIRPVVVGGFVLGGAWVSAGLIARGLWLAAAVLIMAFPMLVVLHRRPLVGVGIWLVLNQVLSVGSGGVDRKAFWVVHRILPPLVVILLVVTALLGIRMERLPRLGWAELSMAAYLVVTVLSVLYHSATATETLYLVYDRVVVPMSLYLIVRLAPPNAASLRRVVPGLAAVLLVQSVIGVMSWVTPASVPEQWLGRLGQRTIGSLGHPNVYGVVVLAIGVILAHYSFTHVRFRRWAMTGFLLSLVMAFLTLGRAVWLAGLVAVIGLFVLYPKPMRRLGVFVVPVLLVVVSAGMLGGLSEMASARFLSDGSERSALSRLPVVVASWRMFEAKPFTGWGYGDFDLYDRRFQTGIEGLINAEKDHASHNLYLTILAEQGLPGLVFYLGPAVVLLIRWLRRRAPHLDTDGWYSRRLVGVMVVIVLMQVVVSNFSNMRIVYGLGAWWLGLGMLASLLAEPRATVPASVHLPLSALLRSGDRHEI